MPPEAIFANQAELSALGSGQASRRPTVEDIFFLTVPRGFSSWN
jgi:hypothetical protein